MSGVKRVAQDRIDTRLKLCWVGLAAAYVGMVMWGARGLQGSDQYWYASDLAMQAAGKGLASNWITPAVWLDSAWSPENLPPPVHNIPVIHLASLINGLVPSPYTAWLIVNLAMGLASALLTYFVSSKVLKPAAATLAAGLLLFSGPFVIWFAMNALAEQSIMLWSLILIAGSVVFVRRPGQGVVLMAGGTVLLAASRESFILLVPAAAILLATLIRRDNGRWRYLVGYLLAALVGIAAADLLLPSYPIFNLDNMLMVHSSGDYLGLGWYLPFSDVKVPFDAGIFLSKMVSQAGVGLIPSGPSDILGETIPILVLVLGVILAPRSRIFNILRYWGVVMFGLYLVTSAVFQSQYRYITPVVPIAIILAVAAGDRLLSPEARIARWFFAVGSLTAMAGVSAFIAQAYAAGVQSDKTAYAALKSRIDGEVQRGGSVLVLDDAENGRPQPLDATSLQALGYLSAPDLLIFGPTAPGSCIPNELVARWDIEYVLSGSEVAEQQLIQSFCDLTTAPEFEGQGAEVTVGPADVRFWRLAS